MSKKGKSREEIEAEVRSRVATEERAYRWVEHLALVESITKDELVKMVPEIMLPHYCDIIEERAISKVCGYPLCSVKLGHRSSQKYRISTKHNKIIDLNERESFCSVYCLKASKYIESQISEVPIWLRSQSVSDVKLLPKGDAQKYGGIGEISFNLDKLHFDDIEKSDVETGEECEIDDDEFPEDEHYDIFTKQSEPVYRKAKEIKIIKDKPKKDENTIFDRISKVSEVLQEWFTDESYRYLSNKHTFSKPGCDSDDEEVASQTNENKDNFQTKVSNFLSHQPEWISESNFGGENQKTEDYLYKKKLTPPSTDSKSRHIIRGRIVHEKLSVSFRKLTPICGLLESDLTKVGFFKLIDTFNFTSKNIVLNAKQWILVTIVLLKIFSSISKDMEMGIRGDEIDNYLVVENLPGMQQIEIIGNEIVSKVLKIDVFYMEELD